MSQRPVSKKFLVPGIPRHSRSTVYRRKGLYKRSFKDVKPAKKDVSIIIQRELKGNERNVPVNKASRWYPAEDIRDPKISRKTSKPTKLRSSITPGTVLILLAGRFHGKKAVFLKQLDNGLLLVTGPYAVNGVPLKRVNQAYVIATSTKLDLDAHDLSKYNGAYFKKPSTSKKNKPTEEEFFEQQKERKTNYSAERKSDQKAIDGVVLKAIKKVDHMEHYLDSNFSLSKGQFPHQMNF